MQTDPALTSFFAEYKLHFNLIDQTHSIPTPITAEDYQYCVMPNPSLCAAYAACTVSYDEENVIATVPNTACQSTVTTASSCTALCAAIGSNHGGVPTTLPDAYCPTSPNLYACSCYSHDVKTATHASCPRVSCTTAGDCDAVTKVRTCADPGSCSATGTGYVGCTTSPPATGHTCNENGPLEVLTVVKGGGPAGSLSSIVSDDGSINCGSTCSIGHLQGDVVQLTATPGKNIGFSGWTGGGCESVGKQNYCDVTTNAATTVTANFACMPSGTLCGETVNLCTSPVPYNNCLACCSGRSTTASTGTCSTHGTYTTLKCQ